MRRLTETARDRRVEIRSELASRGAGRSWQCTHHEPSAGRQLSKPVSAQVLELTAHTVAHDRTADLAPDHETSPGNGACAVARLEIGFRQRQMDDEPGASSPPTQPHRGGEV